MLQKKSCWWLLYDHNLDVIVLSNLGFAQLQDWAGLEVQSPGSVAGGWRVRGHYWFAAADFG